MINGDLVLQGLQGLQDFLEVQLLSFSYLLLHLRGVLKVVKNDPKYHLY